MPEVSWTGFAAPSFPGESDDIRVLAGEGETN